MKKLLTAVLLALTAFGATAHAEVIKTSGNEEFARALCALVSESEISVAEESEFSAGRLIAVADGDFDFMGAETVLCDSDGFYVLKFASASEAERAYNYYLSVDEVSAAPDITLTICDDEDAAEETAHLSWGADFIDADAPAKTLVAKYGTVEAMPVINVAVIDSGVDYTHTFLADRVDYEKGYDYVNGDDDPMDDHSHGTHVAGIICDNTLANVRIIPFKAMDSSGSGELSAIIAALKQAASVGADIINMSIGGTDSNQVIKNATESIFDELAEEGIIVVAAAGNNAVDVKYNYPSNIESVVAVSACDSSGEFASSYSNYGSMIDLCAPGTSICSTVLNGAYGYKSGTSMACPFVSAAAAMVEAVYYEDADVDVIEALENAASAQEETDYYGFGLLNLSAFAPEESPTPDPEEDSTEEPTSSPEATEEPTETPEPTEESTETPEPTSSPEATEEPTETPEPTEEPTETPEPTEEPTETPEPTEEPSETPEPTEEPTATPEPEDSTETPEPSPTVEPTAEPTAEATASPTETPTETPEPTEEPTEEATEEPSEEPTATPTFSTEVSVDRDTLYVTVTNADEGAAVIAAVYASDGSLIALQYGADAAEFEFAAEGAAYVTVMEWASVESMLPLADAVIMEVE